MASIIISGETMKDVPEVNKMVNDLLKGKISMSQFIKFLDENNLKTKIRNINGDINPSVLADFVDKAFSTLFTVPENSEHEDDDEIENLDEEIKKNAKDTVEFAKRLIDDYGDFKEDDIEHAKAVKLFHSMMILGRTFRKRAIKGDEKYQIPNFTPENILKFIETLNLPTDKVEASLKRGRSYYYKAKIYKDFDDFKSSMKDVYGIEDVWNPPKEVPEWFESVRDMQYRKFHPKDVFEVDEDEWNEFKKWKETKNKEDIYEKSNKLFREILKIKPDLDLPEMLGINELAMKGCVKGLEECLECLKKSKNTSINNTILKYNREVQAPTDKKNDDYFDESFENQCRRIVDTIINDFSPILTGEVLKYFEKMYKSNDESFMRQLRIMYNKVKSSKNDGLIYFIDVSKYGDTIICNPIPNTKKDIEEIILATLSKSNSKKSSDKKSSTSKKSSNISYEKTLETLKEIEEIVCDDSTRNDNMVAKKNTSSAKKSSTSKKTTSSASVKNDKTSTKKTPSKSSKTDAKVKEFKKYADYILCNCFVNDNARDLLLSYAANLDERCKKLYDQLVELKKRHKVVRLIKFLDENTDTEDIEFTDNW